ncbi:hypothetical protein H5410_022446, partial [Solanum commersonii]
METPRIDSFSSSMELDDCFGFIKQSLLPKVISDHSPLLLQCNQWVSFDVQGSQDFVFASTLKLQKGKLKKWTKHPFSTITP